MDAHPNMLVWFFIFSRQRMDLCSTYLLRGGANSAGNTQPISTDWIEMVYCECVCVHECVGVCVCMCVYFPNLRYISLCSRYVSFPLISKELMERTEVYEYVLSLTSGIGQPRFQVSVPLSLFHFQLNKKALY